LLGRSTNPGTATPRPAGGGVGAPPLSAALVTSAPAVVLALGVARYAGLEVPLPSLGVAVVCSLLGALAVARPLFGANALAWSALAFTAASIHLPPLLLRAHDLLQRSSALCLALAAGTPAEHALDAEALLFAGGTLLSSLALGYLALRRWDPFWPVAAGMMLFSILWLDYYDAALKYVTWFVVFASALAGPVIAARARRATAGTVRHAEGGAPAATLAWTLVVVLVLAGLARILPKPAPVDLGRVDDVIVEHVPALKRWRGLAGGAAPLMFTLAQTGFAADTAELGGPASPDDSPALRLEVDAAVPGENLYLAGASCATYTGRGWTREGLDWERVGGEAPERGGLHPEAPVREILQEVELLRGPTSTVFAAFEPVRVRAPREILLQDPLGSLCSQRRLNPGARYAVVSTVPVPDRRLIRRLADDPAGPPLLPPATRRMLLRLPRSLPERVRAVAARVCAGRDTQFDKALALEEYLRDLEYDLDVPQTPPGRDFVDYFLFDLRRGYCTYHSTAMAVLLRCEGIPSRWTQGYIAEAKPGLEVTVPNSNAHAWVEAWIDGYGWARFDPTPRFARPRWAPALGASPEGTTGGIDAYLSPDVPRLRRTPPAEAGPTGQADQPARHSTAVAVVLVAALAVAAVARSALRARTLEGRRASKEPPRAATCRSFELAEQLISLFGPGRRPSQTAGEYAETVAEWASATFSRKRAGSISRAIRLLARMYTQARYGKGPVPDETARNAKETQALLARLIHEAVGSPRYYRRMLTR